MEVTLVKRYDHDWWDVLEAAGSRVTISGERASSFSDSVIYIFSCNPDHPLHANDCSNLRENGMLQTTGGDQAVTVLSTSEILQKAKASLALNISEIADILAVSRPTIYSYLSGNEPTNNSEMQLERINCLNMISDAVLESGLPTPNFSIMKRRDSDGRTLKDLIFSGSLVPAMITTFIQCEREQYEKTKRRISQNSLKKRNMDNQMIGISAYIE